MSMFSTIKEIYLDSKINSIIYPHLKCIMCYMNDSHLSIFARVARQKFSSSGTVLACQTGQLITFISALPPLPPASYMLCPPPYPQLQICLAPPRQCVPGLFKFNCLVPNLSRLTEQSIESNRLVYLVQQSSLIYSIIPVVVVYQV